MKESLLKPLMIVGQKFFVTHPDLAKHEITECILIGDHGTKSQNYWLMEGTRPDGTLKRMNFRKSKFECGLLDKHFTPILPSVTLMEDTSVHKIS